MLVFTFAISGVFGIYLNYHSEGCSKTIEEYDNDDYAICITDFISIFGIGNARNNTAGLIIQLFLNIATLFFMIIFCYYIKYTLRRKLEENNLKILTAANYTVMLEGLPTDKSEPMSSGKEITKWIESQGTPEKPFKVMKVSRCYRIHSYIRIIRKIDKIKH